MRVTDIHIHIQPWWELKPAVQARMAKGRENFDELLAIMKEPARLLRLMDAEGIERAGLINYPSPDLMGFGDGATDFVLDYTRAAPDRLIPFSSVHARYTPAQNTRQLVDRMAERGVRAIKIHPSHQLVYPNDYLNGNDTLRFTYERAQAHGLVVMIHTGTSIFPGARNKFAHPMFVDDVAIDFPDLRIILAHGGRPLWMAEAFFLARRFPNLFLDLSGIPPRLLPEYFPRLEAIADKVLWGTDWPAPGVPGMGANLEAFRALGYPEAMERKVLEENAARLFPR